MRKPALCADPRFCGGDGGVGEEGARGEGELGVVEEDAIVVVAADAGGGVGAQEVEGAEGAGGGAFGDYVAGDDEVVGCGVVGEFVEEILDWGM